MTLDFFERFRENLDRAPDRPALQAIGDAGRESFTYARVAREIRKIGAFLRGTGIGPGDPVGILVENHPRWGIAFLAAQSAGAVIVPLDTLHSAGTLAGLIRHAECKYLIVSQRQAPAWREIQRMLPAPLPTLAIGEQIEGCAEWDAVLATPGDDAALPLVSRTPDDDLVIIYTSGTTGNPKGVVLTQRNVYRNVVEILKIIDARATDHFLSVLPLYHVFALMTTFIIPLYLGARVTYLQSIEAQRVLRTFREEKISVFLCVPQFFYLVHRRILQEVDRQGFLKRMLFRRLLAISRFANLHLGLNPGRLLFRTIHRKFGTGLRILGVGGARFDREVAESFRDLGFRIAQAFGMTETAALVTVAPPKGRFVGAVGRPMPHCEIRIEEPDENGIGEVHVRGENVMRGYLKNPEATAEAIQEGWLHTGDLGYIDGSGCLVITGRMKDVIVLSSGKNIYPEEVEHFYLSNCPLIKEMCVLGMPGSDSGAEEDKLHAVIVPDFEQMKVRQIVSAQDTIRWHLETLSERLPEYKRVRSFEIRTEALPVTTTRKLKRFQIQKETSEKRERAAPAPVEETPPETPVEEKVFELIRRLKEGAPIQHGMNLELDLGITSLERVELLANVQEAFGVRLPEETAARLHTVRDLTQAVEQHLGDGAASVQTARLQWGELLGAPLQPEDARGIREVLAPRRWFEPVYWLIGRTVRWFGIVLFNLECQGLENLPKEYPFLICPNHLSFLDAFLVACELPHTVLRRLFILGGVEFFSGRLTSFVGKLARVVPVSQDRGLQHSLRLAAEGLARGFVLLVFPEGERSIDGKLKTFRKSAAILAAETGAPVVPVSIVGTYEIWRRGSDVIRRHPVTVTFGPPLCPAKEAESYEEFTGRLKAAVRKLAGQAGAE